MRKRFESKLDTARLEDSQRSRRPKTDSTRCSVSAKIYFPALLYMGCLSILVAEFKSLMPKPLLREDESSNPDRFIAERAMNHVISLTSLGPRPVGSFANEVLAVAFLTKEISTMIKKSNGVHRMSLDVQKASGSFNLKFFDGMVNVYENVQNVIVKIGPQEPSPRSLLLNCHFDSVADSPGGSDDGAGCAVLLEVLRVISESSKPLKNNLIFLFNGAEEAWLQASHGFVTQHKWAKEIEAFINIEACGAVGKELLFQAGPENPWLIQAYADTVPSPAASSLAQEIFQSGLIPGETDYRIFRDFGKVPGLDFAWAQNGYVYHTKLDDAAQIPLGSLQRTGDNILPLTLHLSESLESSELEKEGNLIFFDFFGKFVIICNEQTGLFIGLFIVTLSFYSLYKNFSRETFFGGMKKTVYLNNLLIFLIIVYFSFLLTLVMSGMISTSVTVLDRAMSWYATPIWAFFLYTIPSILVPLTIVQSISKRTNHGNQGTLSRWSAFVLYYDCNQLAWTLAVIVCLILRIRSGFIPGIWVLFASILNLLKTQKKMKGGLGMVSVYLGTMTIPFFIGTYIVQESIMIVLPIMGRTGAGNNTELIFGLITTASCMFLLNFVVPLFILVTDQKRILVLLWTILGASILILILTPLGFPYSSDKVSPRPQKYTIIHTERTIYSPRGEVESQSGGYWVADMDINSPSFVSGFVPEMSKAQLITKEQCDKYLYCGLPYLYPVVSLIWKTHWIPAPTPVFPTPCGISLLEMELMPDGYVRFKFNATGPDHRSLVISPVREAELVSWSFNSEPPMKGPKWGDRETYFVHYTCASSCEPLTFWVDLKVEGHPANTLDIAYTGHFLHGPLQNSVKFNKFLSQFPPWTITTAWTSVYKSYVF